MGAGHAAPGLIVASEEHLPVVEAATALVDRAPGVLVLARDDA